MVESRQSTVLAVTISFLVLSSIFVFFRFISKALVVRRVGPDDYWILGAWLVAFGFSSSICYGTSVGLGRHEADLPSKWHSPLRKSEYAFSVLYNPALMATKTSILAFFLQLSKEELLFRRLCWLTLLVVNAAGLALTFVNVFQCRPLGATFEDPIPSMANCTDIVTLYLSSAPVNIITDLAILFLPMPILTRLRLPKKQKIILVITFSFGAFVAVVDVVRIAYLQSASLARLGVVGKKDGKPSQVVEQDDFSWYASYSFMWSAIEVNLGIMCACVPSLKPLVGRFLPQMIRDVDSPTEKSGSSGPVSHNTHGAHDRGLPSMPKSPEAATGAVPFSSTSPEPPVNRAESDDKEMDFLDFLQGPDDDAPAAATATNLTRQTTRANSVRFFDFVKMQKPKSMVKLTNRESAVPIALTTTLFFLWGFAYGLLDVLNGQFEIVVKMTPGEAVGLHASYYSGYLVGPLTIGQFVLRRYGFKASFITGLCIYACGTLVFWPASVLTSYTAFVISNLIVGCGLSTLEVAANPFIALCGPLEYAEVRLNISQGFQAIGTVISPLLAKKVFFKDVLDAPSLVNVQWAYLGIALFDVLLAVVFFYLPVPEASDDELEELADRRSAVNSAKVGGFPVIWVTLAFGVFCQFCYVGGQETLGGSIINYVPAVKTHPTLHAFDYETIGHTVFAVGRFLSAFLNYILKPRWILLALYLGLVVSGTLAMTLTGDAGIAMMMLTYLLESGAFSIIFAIVLRGMGAHTKWASAIMTAAISGGALFPVIQNPVIHQRGIRYSLCIVVAAFAFGTVFPFYLNLVSAAKKQVDPYHEPRTRSRRRYTLRNMSDASRLEPKVNAFGLSGIMARRKKATSTEVPSTEHFEGNTRSVEAGPSSPRITTPKAPMPLELRDHAAGVVGELQAWPDNTSGTPTSPRGGMAHDLAAWHG